MSAESPLDQWIDPAVPLSKEHRKRILSDLVRKDRFLPSNPITRTVFKMWWFVAPIGYFLLHMFGFPWWVAALGAGAAMYLCAIIVGWLTDEQSAAEVRREVRRYGWEVCVKCGYWLRGLPADEPHCPECGSPREPMPNASIKELEIGGGDKP